MKTRIVNQHGTELSEADLPAAPRVGDYIVLYGADTKRTVEVNHIEWNVLTSGQFAYLELQVDDELC